MIIDRDYVQYYISVVSYKIQNLLNHFEELSQKDYISTCPGILIELLLRILSRFIEELRQTNKKVKIHPPEDILKKIQTIHYYITVFMPIYIEAIETADFDSSTASIIQIFDDIVYNIRVGSKVIVHPSWEYNASYIEIMESLRDMTSDMGGETAQQAIFSGSPPYFSIITYPRVEDDIVLRQALIAHEVGHFFDQVHNWSGLFPYEYPLDYPEIKDQLFEEIDNLGVDEKEQLKEKSFETIKEIRPNWISEVVADLIAAAILGPAYIFAFDEFTLSSYSNNQRFLSKSHPPSVYRLNLIATTISELFFDGIDLSILNANQKDLYRNIVKRVNKYKIKDYKKNIKIQTSFGKEFDAIQNLILHYLFQNLYQVQRIVIDELMESIRSRFWILEQKDIVSSIILTELIEDGLIPSELYGEEMTMPTFGAVMNSGWFLYLNNPDDYNFFYEENGIILISEEAKGRFQVLQELIAKASEAIQFKKEYNKRKGVVSEKE